MAEEPASNGEVDEQAPIRASTFDVTNAVREALEPGNEEGFRQLVDWVNAGGDLTWTSPNGWTLLHLAAQCSNEEMVRFLVERGADIEARDDDGETPLMLACDTGWAALRLRKSPPVVKALLELGANPNAERKDGRTALSLLFLMSAPAAKEITTLLEAHEAEQEPGVSATCPECGAPDSARMKEHGVMVTFEGEFVAVPCPHCRATTTVPLESIDKSDGLMLPCQCGQVVLLSGRARCWTCGTGMSEGWGGSQVSPFGRRGGGSSGSELPTMEDHSASRFHSGPQHGAVTDRPPNEGLQQTRSALTSIAAALAAESWCSADRAGQAPG